MTAIRCVQNFSQRRALIVSDDYRALGRLDDYLIRLGLSVQYLPFDGGTVDLNVFGVAPNADVLFLDGDLGSAVFVPRYPESELPIVPVVGMVGIEAPSRLGALFANGATAFIKKPIHVGSVFSSLFMAVNAHKQRVALLEKSQDLQSRRNMRRFVIKAIVLLMEQLRIDDERAYILLRERSMDAQSSVEEYCKQFVQRHDESGSNDVAQRCTSQDDFKVY